MDFEDFGETEDNEEDESPYGEDKYGIKPTYIVAIDTKENMFEFDEANAGAGTGNPLYMKQVLLALKETYESLFFVYKTSNPIAVLLAYDDDEKVPLIKHSATIPEAIETLEKLLAMPEDAFLTTVMRTSECSLANFMFFCQRTFAEAPKSENADRKLIYITRDDHPFEGGAQEVEEGKFRALNTLKALGEGVDGVNFQLVPYKKAFNTALFYEDVVKEIPESFTVEGLDSHRDLGEKLKRELSVVNKKTVRLYWKKGESKEYFLVDVVSVSKKQSLLKKRASRQNLEVLQQKYEHKLLLEDGDDAKHVIYPKNLAYKIELSAEQVERTKKKIPNGIHLDSVSVPHHRTGYSVAKNRLIFASPKASATDKDIYDAIWSNCFEKKRALQCWMQLQSNQRIKKVELAPHFIDSKRAFVLRQLPALNNIRFFDVPEGNVDDTPTEAGKELMRRMLRSLHVDFHPMQIENPRVEARKKYLMCKMLERPFVRPSDSIEDIVQDVEKKLGNLGERFGEVFRVEVVEPKKKRLKTK